jgi:hypothetical protein
MEHGRKMSKDTAFVEAVLESAQKHPSEAAAKASVKSFFEAYVAEARGAYQGEATVVDHVRNDVSKLRDLLPQEVNSQAPGLRGR